MLRIGLTAVDRSDLFDCSCYVPELRTTQIDQKICNPLSELSVAQGILAIPARSNISSSAHQGGRQTTLSIVRFFGRS
jgi:hypothetical protein